MKHIRLFYFAFAGILLAALFLFSGCAQPVTAGSGEISVVTTVFPPYDFALAIGGEHATVTQLLRPGAESHTYDPTPADILLVRDCDLFLYIGGESDAWVDTLLDAAEPDDGKRKVLRLIETVDCVEEETVEGMTVHEHEHGDSDEIEYDEHIWTSPKNAMRMCEAICSALCECAPDCSDDFQASLRDYLTKLSALDEQFSGVVSSSSCRTLVFGDRFPFRYLCDAYGLSYRAAFPGCAEESEPSAATVAELIGKIREEKLPAVLTMELSNGKIARAISEETGAKVLMLHSCHNRTADETAAGLGYLDLMRRNAETLKEALNGG